MATLLIRRLDDDLKAQLRVRAAENGHSMEEEARSILRRELERPSGPHSIASLAHELFGGAGLGVDLESHPSVPVRTPPAFGE